MQLGFRKAARDAQRGLELRDTPVLEQALQRCVDSGMDFAPPYDARRDRSGHGESAPHFLVREFVGADARCKLFQNKSSGFDSTESRFMTKLSFSRSSGLTSPLPNHVPIEAASRAPVHMNGRDAPAEPDACDAAHRSAHMHAHVHAQHAR